jgi:TonB family protein
MKLEIKEPCHEDWDNMKIGLISRHCDVCVKSVMDFTQMNRAQIITYILSNPNEQVCGRMNKDQFDFQHEDIPVLIEELKKGKATNPFLILALVCLSLSACAQDKNGNIQTPPPIEVVQGQVEHNPDDSTRIAITEKPPRDHPIRKGKVACEIIEEVELGEIEPVEIGDIEVAVSGGIGIVEQPVEHPVEDKVYQFAEKMPEFSGGMEKLFDFVNKNLSYPRYERDKNISGNVYVRFVVEKDGSITRPEIMRSVVGSKNFDAEVLRIIRMMPKWTPGENHGNKVSVYMSLPIQFRLK